MFEALKNKKVLITGATGLVGAKLTARLADIGADVRAIYHRRPIVSKDSRVEYLQADLCHPEDCAQAVKGIEYLFHCAAQTAAAIGIAKDPMALVTPNLVMHSQIFQAAYDAGVTKVLWTSSSWGYPERLHEIREDEMFDEEPYEKYYSPGWMIRFIEILCKMYGQKLQKKMTMIVLRPTNIYGPHDNFDPISSHVLPALIRKVVERQDPVEVWGNGEDIRDMIYVDDVIEAILLAMQKVETTTAINIGLGKGYSVKEMLKLILKIDDYENAKIIFNRKKPTMIPVRLLDTAKSEKDLGFKAQVSLEEGIRKTISWYRNHCEA